MKTADENDHFLSPRNNESRRRLWAIKFADIVLVEEFIEGQENDAPELKTEQNIALLKEFLAIKGESRAVEEIPSHEFIIYTVRKKEDNNRL